MEYLRGVPWGTQRRVDNFNYVFRLYHPDVDLRDYGLPEDEVTLVGVIDNWEIVKELLMKYPFEIAGF